MTDEERTICQKCSRENPFRTPEGYFEILPDRVMQRIHRHDMRRKAWRWAVAAAFIGCVATAGLMSTMHDDTAASLALEIEDYQYIEDAIDYSMIDNMEIASYLTEAE